MHVQTALHRQGPSHDFGAVHSLRPAHLYSPHAIEGMSTFMLTNKGMQAWLATIAKLLPRRGCDGQGETFEQSKEHGEEQKPPA